MARKGLWQRLFGKGDKPEKDTPQTPPPTGPTPEPELPAYPQHDSPQPHTPPTDSTDPDPDAERHAGHETTTPDDLPDLIEIDAGPPPQTPDEDTPAEPEPADPAPEPPTASETTLPQTAELKTDAVGRVYAQSLIELAQDAGEVDAIAEEVAGLLPLVEPGGELYLLVTNPAISTDERSKIVSRVFEGKVSDLLYRFLQVVASKGRLGSLQTILGGYLMLVTEARGLINVDAYVATAMDPDTAARVAEQIGNSLGKQVTLRQHVDESLIGGLKIKVGDKLIDASVASQLNQMKRNMMRAR